jgi:hypothetical protein
MNIQRRRGLSEEERRRYWRFFHQSSKSGMNKTMWSALAVVVTVAVGGAGYW